MASKKFLLNKSLFLLLWLGVLLPGSRCLAASSFTVELGGFKTMTAVTAVYDKIPEALNTQAVICHAGDTYNLRCGETAGPEQLNGIFNQLKGAGLSPTIIQADLGGCVPALQFVKTFDTKTPPAPSTDSVPPPLPRKTESFSTNHISSSMDDRSIPKPPIKKESPYYEDLNNPPVMQYLNSTAMMVRPDVATKVIMSNRDVNRISCQGGAIKDVIYSKEKGINVKIDKDNAFVKFLINGNPATGNMSYASTPSEFYVVCGQDVYTLIALPRDVPAQTIALTSPQKHIEKNIALFKGLSIENIIVSLVKDAYRDKIPDSFTVTPVNQTLNIFRNIHVVLKRRVTVDGEGLSLKEYALTLKSSSPVEELPIEEKNFLILDLAKNPVGISLDHVMLKKGEFTRLFIIEKHNQETN